MIDTVIDIADLRISAFRLYQLKTPPYERYWAIDVSGNYRIFFIFSNGKASNLE